MKVFELIGTAEPLVSMKSGLEDRNNTDEDLAELRRIYRSQ